MFGKARAEMTSVCGRVSGRVSGVHLNQMLKVNWDVVQDGVGKPRNLGLELLHGTFRGDEFGRNAEWREIHGGQMEGHVHGRQVEGHVHGRVEGHVKRGGWCGGERELDLIEMGKAQGSHVVEWGHVNGEDVEGHLWVRENLRRHEHRGMMKATHQSTGNAEINFNWFCVGESDVFENIIQKIGNGYILVKRHRGAVEEWVEFIDIFILN